MADPTDSLIVAGTVNAMVGGPPIGVERVGGMVTAMVGGLPAGTFRVAGMVVAMVVAPKQSTPSQVMLGTF